MTFEAILPLPPSANNLFANVPGQGRVKTREYRTWQTAAGWRLFAQVSADMRVTGPYVVDIILPEKMLGDIDNRIKPILDLLVGMERTPDDKHLRELHVYKNRAEPSVLVRVTGVGK